MKNYFISTNAACYDDFLKYYLNREFLKQMSADNSSNPKYNNIHGPFGKQVVTAPYKKYEMSDNTAFKFPFNSWTKAQINAFSDDAAFMADVATKQRFISFGIPSTTTQDLRPGWTAADLDIVGDWSASETFGKLSLDFLARKRPVPAVEVKGVAFGVQGDEGSTIWSPKGDVSLYNKIAGASTDNKFIFVDFNNLYSEHFDTYWSRVEACNSGWNDTTKAENKDQTRLLLGCSMYTAEDKESDGSTTTNTIKNYPLGYPTYVDGVKNDRVHVLEIDKLLDKDSKTMTDLATFMGISVSDDATNVIDTFLNDIK
tara:strand:+ start:340 stop:1281 length:942 start_codon:yes stop_codon:yes gene_type:complete